MLSAQANERITRVGPGTPAGELLRRYWMPVAPKAEIDEVRIRPVRLLGEDLVVYKDSDGAAGAKIYDGSLDGLGSVSLGTFAADGDAHTFYFHVVLPTTGSDAGDNAFQGKSASASFTWSATPV